MTTEKGVWNLQQVRDKQLQSLWDYSGAGSLWMAGSYLPYNLTGAPYNRSSPVQVPGSALWTTKQSAGGGNNYNVKSDGTLWSMGGNNKGQLGIGNNTNQSSPIQIGSGTDWSDVESSSYWALALKTDGTLWSWGDNRKGQLGQNNKTEYNSPVQIPGTTWSKLPENLLAYGVEPGVAAIKSDGTLWSWGYNDYVGELGLNDRANRSSPTQIPGTTWSTVSCGGGNMVAIKTDGTLWTWGANGSGILGQNVHDTPAKRSSPVQIYGGGTTWAHATVNKSTAMSGVKTDGTLWVWGDNYKGQLGLNEQGTDATYRSSPTQVPGTTWSKCYVGNTSMMALKTDGTLWAWGYVEYGTLAINKSGPDTSSVSSPTQIPGVWQGVSNAMYHSSLIRE